MMNELDKINMIRQAERRALAKGQEKGEKLGLKKGRAEGERVGLEKGRAEGKVEIARNMLAEGVDDSMIARFTGLTSEQVNELKRAY